MIEESLDDLELGRSSFIRPRPTPASILYCKMKGGGPGKVSQRHVTAMVQQAFNSCCATCTDSTVKRSSTVFVLGIDLGAGLEQAQDGLHLIVRTPIRTARASIGCVVQRATATMIQHRVWIGTGSQQQLHEFNPVTSRREMEGRIAHIHPMMDLCIEKVRLADRSLGKRGVRLQQSTDLRPIVI